MALRMVALGTAWTPIGCPAVLSVLSLSLNEPMQVRVARGDPVDVSYWLMRNMPLGAVAHQELLASPTVVQRLRALCAEVASYARHFLRCRVCNCQVALLPRAPTYQKSSGVQTLACHQELLAMPICSAGSSARG